LIGMSADAWVTLATMTAMIVVLARGLGSAPAAVVGAAAFDRLRGPGDRALE